MPRVRVLAALLTVLAAPPAARAQLPLLHTLQSPNAGASGGFGQSVAGIGDVNGDGRGDILVGAYKESSAIVLRMGRAYVYSGATGAILDTLFSPAPNVTTDGDFGRAVANVPDLNGDGRSEYLIGAPGETGGADNAGRAYVYSGITEVLLRSLVSPNPTANGSFGTAVAVVPDVTGDGVVDLLVGASGEGPGGVTGAGRAYVFNGATGALVRSLISPSPEEQGRFGFSVSGVSDVNGDGRGELFVSAKNEDNGQTDAGRAHLFDGATGALLRTVFSPNPSSLTYFGTSVATVPDTDGDGRADLLVGAEAEGGGIDGSGRAYLFSGATGGLLRTFVSPNWTLGGSLGHSVAGVPDVNGDGRGDVLVAAPGEDGGGTDSGRAYLFSGATGTLIRFLASANAETGGGFGWGVSAVPDADGDGRADLLVGAPQENGGASNAGRAYVFSTSAVVATEPGTGTSGSTVELTVVPNPIAAHATLAFVLHAAAPVRLTIHDALGREVVMLANDVRAAGRHEAALDGYSLAEGVYLARLEAAGEVVTRRVVVSR